MSYPRMCETFHSCFSFHMCVNFMKKDSFTQFTVAICKPRHWNWNWNWYYKRYYFQLHKAYKHQTYHGGDLGWGDPTHQVTWHFDIVVTWQIKNVISPPSLDLWTPNLPKWWVRMRGPHLQRHVTHRPWGHVTNQKRCIPTFTRPMDPKHSGLVTSQ